MQTIHFALLLGCMASLSVVNGQVPLSQMVGFYSSACELITSSPTAVYFNADINLSSGGTAVVVTWRMFLDSACQTTVLRLVMTSTNVENAVLWNQTDFDMHVTSIKVTPLNTQGTLVLDSQCPLPFPQFWQTKTYDVTTTCKLSPTLPIPSKSDCPIYYTSFQYVPATPTHNATLYSAAMWNVDTGGNPICSASDRAYQILTDRAYLSAVAFAGNNDGGGGGDGGSGCVALPSTSFCTPYINYNVGVQPGTTIASMEQDIFLLATPLAWSVMLSDPCRNALGSMMCGQVYKRCNSTQPMCFSACHTINTNCTAVERANLTVLFRLLSIPDFNGLCAASGVSQCAAPGPSNTGLVLSGGPVLPYPTCQAYIGTSCSGVVDYMVYVPANSSMSLLEQQAQSRFAFIFALAPQQTGCLEAMARYACSQVFLRCDTTVITNASVPFPRLPCQSLCTDYASICSDFIAFDSRLQPNCSSTGQYVAGVPDFPDNSTLFPLGLTSQCSRGSFATVSPSYTCLWPLVRPQDPNAPTLNGGGCALPCKLPFFTEEDYANQDSVLRGSAFFHVVGLFFTTFTLAFLVEQRTRAQQYLIHLHICLWPATFAIIISLMMTKPENSDRGYGVFAITCKDNTQVWAQGENSFCDFETVVNQFTIVAGCCWLMAYSFELFISITRLREKIPSLYLDYSRYFWWVFSYTIPSSVVLAAIAQEAIAGDNIFPWCSIEAAPIGKQMWKIVASTNIIASFFLLTSLLTLLRTCYVTRKVSGVNAVIYLRPILFMVVFLGIFGYSYGYHFYVWAVEDEWEQLIQDWVLCWTVFLPAGYVSSCASRPNVSTKGDWQASIDIIVSLGWISLICIGLTWTNINLWRAMIVRKYPPAGEWTICGHKICRGVKTMDDVGGVSHNSDHSRAGSKAGPASVVVMHNNNRGSRNNINVNIAETNTSPPASPSSSGGGGGGFRTALVRAHTRAEGERSQHSDGEKDTESSTVTVTPPPLPPRLPTSSHMQIEGSVTEVEGSSPPSVQPSSLQRAPSASSMVVMTRANSAALQNKRVSASASVSSSHASHVQTLT